MRVKSPWSGCIAFGLALWGFEAKADAILDQSVDFNSPGIYASVGIIEAQLAQTFTVGVTGYLGTVEVSVIRTASNPGTDTLLVYVLPTTPAGAPVEDLGQALAVGVIPADEVPIDESIPPTPEYVRFNLSSPFFAALGDRLAIAVASDDTDGIDNFWWLGDGGYSGGSAQIRILDESRYPFSNPPWLPGELSTWGTLPIYSDHTRGDTRDFGFRTYMAVSPQILIDGGSVQECESHSGTSVSATVQQPVAGVDPSDTVVEVEWQLDGTIVGYGDSVEFTAALGSHDVDVFVTTGSGQRIQGRSTLEIEDTVAPTVEVAFLNSNDQEIERVSSNKPTSLEVDISVEDVCDANPIIQSMGGVTVVDGEEIEVRGSKDRLILEVETFEVKATAEDASGNVGEGQATLIVSD
jgi:hypothetical protein